MTNPTPKEILQGLDLVFRFHAGRTDPMLYEDDDDTVKRIAPKIHTENRDAVKAAIDYIKATMDVRTREGELLESLRGLLDIAHELSIRAMHSHEWLEKSSRFQKAKALSALGEPE